MEKYDRLLEEPFEFDFNENVSFAWDLMKQTKWSFLGFLLIAWIASAIVSGLSTLLSGEIVTVNIIFSLISNLFSAVLMAGVFVYFQEGVLNQNRFDFGNFFAGFKKVVPIGLSQIAIWVMMLPAFLVLGLTVFSIDDIVTLINSPLAAQSIFQNINISQVIIGVAVVIIVAMSIGLTYCISVPIIVNNEIGFWDAMELSRKLVWKNFGQILWFYVATFFIVGFVGMLVGGLLMVIMIVPFLGWLIGIAGILILGTMMMAFMYGANFGIYYQAFKPILGQDLFEEKVSSFGSSERDINTESQEDFGKPLDSFD